MIKEKDTYYFDSQAEASTAVIMDEENAVDINVIRGLLEEYIAQNNIPAVLSEDVFSFKVSTFKKDAAPCIVLSHEDKPKEFRRMMIAMKHFDGKVVASASWYGYSKADQLIMKSEKLDKKADKEHKKVGRSDKYEDTSGIILHGSMSIIHTSSCVHGRISPFYALISVRSYDLSCVSF